MVSDAEVLSAVYDVRCIDFDRSILDQLEAGDDVILVDWELESPDPRGVLDALSQSAPSTPILAVASDVPTDDPVDRGADEYLVTPVSVEKLRSTIDRLVLQHAYEEAMCEYFRLATERALLENEREAGVDVDERYEQVVADLHEWRERADSIRAEFSREGFDRALRRLLSE
ncbi:HalX domain-containing protein [Natronosalvus caseinilyticus]|uniref:HalX domain-containing protein n=1 Tax=Natronosalvus caseinilyticus TaxID=2953747 RepID=UPI0028B12CBD|nr:HalX domain-containing protein [Natronosalvus caseinilyticus]